VELYELTFILDQPIYVVKSEFEKPVQPLKSPQNNEKRFLAIFKNEPDRNLKNAKNEIVFEKLIQALNTKLGILITIQQFDIFYTENLMPAALPNFEIVLFFGTKPTQLGWEIDLELHQPILEKQKTYLAVSQMVEIEEIQNLKLLAWKALLEVFTTLSQ
jgi:hypothetical protein